ncbi:MAG: zinc ABC transporter substrate-binding protein [Desulfurococcaceae archaeon]
MHSFGKPLYFMKTSFLLIFIFIHMFFTNITSSSDSDVLVIVTTNGLLMDVEKLVCSGDRVEALVVANIDPHHYSLSPEDIAKIKNSDIVVTTGHMDFEIKIREMVLQGEINVELVDPLLINGVLIKNIPGTKNHNLHGIFYDPNNYKLLVTEIYNRLIRINPSKYNCYHENYSRVIREIERLQTYKNIYNVKAVADTPIVQYAIEWLGIEILDVVVKEHDLPPDPRTLVNIEELLRNRNVDLVVTTFPSNSDATKWLIDKALKYDIPILKIYDPNYGEDTLTKLTHIIDFLENKSFAKSSSVTNNKNTTRHFWTLVFALIVGVISPIFIMKIMKRKY